MGKITIGKKDFESEECNIHHSELLFYEDNPRIHSILQSTDAPVSQEGIEEILSKMDHVKQLRTAIEQNGGLTESLIVIKRDENYVVLEGNSRLAAYRLLAGKDPIKWSKVTCAVLPNTISDDDIFTLLGQYHLVSKKDWAPFEQAAFLYRKKKASGIETDTLAKSVGLKTGVVNDYLQVYEFMFEKGDLRPEKWSYYYEYLKSGAIKKYRETSPDIDDTIVSQIKSDTIESAIDIRNKLVPIAKGKDKTSTRLMKEIIEQKTSVYDAYDRYESTGKAGGAYTKIKKIRETITDDAFLKKLKREASDTKEIEFELKKINKAIDKILREING